MSADDRVRRPPLERDHPIRNWSSFFAPGNGASPGNGSGEERAPDPVARAVELGYAVIDEYIRQGQNVARGVAQQMGDRGFSAMPPTGEWQQAMSRMAQLSAEWMGMWFELAQRAMGPVDGGAGSSWRSPFPATGGSPAHGTSGTTGVRVEHARVRVEVAAARPIEVSLDLRTEELHAALVVHSLRAVDPSLPRLTEVSFVPATGDAPAVLRVRVPVEHPPGTYRGVVIDPRSNRPAGSVAVRVLPA